MAINYISNDPLAGAPVNVQIAAVADRSATSVRIVVSGLAPQGPYAPGTREFVAWQSREAAFRTLDVFEQVCGHLIGWQGSSTRKTLRLLPLAGNDLNAYYDRNSVSFFEAPVGATMVFSGASADVVAHEVGHAILDALRPDFWNVQLMEVAAFHEGFGDCIAVMFALSDRATRQALLAAPGGLGTANFVEATAEELSDAIRRAVGPNHNAAAPRRALNTYQWALPATLPANGPPGTLINEPHSLGQLASGIYYDLIAAFFATGSGSEANLWTACQQATRLIVDAARQCPVAPRFFESWGRTMLALDHARSGGANAGTIKAVFQAHNIPISSAGFLSPQASLTSGKRKRRAKSKGGTRVTPTARTRLKQILNLAPDTVLHTRSLDLGDEPVTEISTEVEVDLTGLSERLTNVKSSVPRPILVGDTDGTEAVLGAIQPAVLLSSAVREFVETLVTRRSIAFDPDDRPQKGKRRKAAAAAAGYLARDNAKTFEIVEEGGEAHLRRIAFSCGCSSRPK